MIVPRTAKRFLTLSWSEQLIVARAFVDLMVFELALRAVGLERVSRFIKPAVGSAERRLHPAELLRIQEYVRWIDAVARRQFVPAYCLCRSLVLHHWLRKMGLPSELRIGIRKELGSLKAHAWIELGGEIVNDRWDDVAAYTPLSKAHAPKTTCPVGEAARQSKRSEAREGRSAS